MYNNILGSSSNNNCSVCLKLTVDVVVRVNECIDGTTDTWLSKLQYIVPEVDWLDTYLICQICMNQLKGVYQFRETCIRLDIARQEIKQHNTLVVVDKSSLTKIDKSANATINNKQFECKICGKLYTLEKVMLNHLARCDGIRRHSKTGSYQCDKCTKRYTTEKILKSHRKKCTDKNKSPDHRSNDQSKKTISMIKSKGRRSTRTFTCEKCNVTAIYAKVIVAHCIEHHQMDGKLVKPYACTLCTRRFTTSANLVQHEKYHDGSRTHICSFCGKSYITKSDLTVHEYTHYNRRNYKCVTCAKAFNSNKNLRTHTLVVHTDAGQWKWMCTLCARRFPLKSGYDQHMRRHRGDKPFACHICAKSFVTRSELQKHMTFHTNVRAFRCALCQKEYKERSVYEVHLMRAHQIGDAKVPSRVRVRKFKCHLCPNGYFDRQKLTRHLCTHSGLKPFGCECCDKRFTDKYYLKNHLRTVHNNMMISSSSDNK